MGLGRTNWRCKSLVFLTKLLSTVNTKEDTSFVWKIKVLLRLNRSFCTWKIESMSQHLSGGKGGKKLNRFNPNLLNLSNKLNKLWISTFCCFESWNKIKSEKETRSSRKEQRHDWSATTVLAAVASYVVAFNLVQESGTGVRTGPRYSESNLKLARTARWISHRKRAK